MKFFMSLARTLPDQLVAIIPAPRKIVVNLPIIPLGRYIGTMPSTSPHENALKYAQDNDLELYTGFFLNRKDTTLSWLSVQHSFCVDGSGRVIEPTKMPWEGQTFYIGRRVPKCEYKNLKFVHTIFK